MRHKWLAVSGILILFTLIIVALVSRCFSYDPFTFFRSAPIGTGYAAKMLCSGVFVSGREPGSLWREDLELMRNNMIRGSVDYKNKTAEAHVFGFLLKRTAAYSENCGCTLLLGGGEDEFRKECEVELPGRPGNMENTDWPMGDRLTEITEAEAVNTNRMDKILDWAFEKKHKNNPIRTRAVIVINDGRIVAERYADGITKDTRLLGWSMSKSVTSALIGILVRQGKIDIYRPAPIPEWKSPGDPRAGITTDQLLRMSSGLVFVEEYEEDPDSDAGFMLFTVRDMASYAAKKKAEAPPDKKFNYSSGTTMLLSRIIRETVGGSYNDYLAFPLVELFEKIGMRSALIEPDPSGTMVGAGFTYATARDWARFGLLYMNDGVWNGERILPEGWVKYSTTPTPTNHQYGAQFWLNAGETEKDRLLPDCPPDTYMAWGHEGQLTTIVPSRNIVIVRLGQTPGQDDNWDHNYFVSNILKSFPD